MVKRELFWSYSLSHTHKQQFSFKECEKIIQCFFPSSFFPCIEKETESLFLLNSFINGSLINVSKIYEYIAVSKSLFMNDSILTRRKNEKMYSETDTGNSIVIIFILTPFLLKL